MLGTIQDFVTLPNRSLRSAYTYLTNRYSSKTHALTSKLKRGQWYEYEHRLLHCVFDSLVDYVEIDEAWHHIICDSEAAATYKPKKFWWSEWRCAAAGIDHVTWASKLVHTKEYGITEDSPEFGQPTGQAKIAQELLVLYTWWTVERPNRPDPHEVSGWSAFCESYTDDGKKLSRIFGTRTPAQQKESTRLLKLMTKIEDKYEKEDEQMLIRLIKIRKGLWT